MFENLLRTLEGMKSVSIPVNADKDGYIDKECPNDQCTFTFKVHGEDWTNLFSDEKVFCPMCRHEASSDNWWTTEQIQKAREQAMNYVESQIDQAMEEDARDFNARQSSNAFIKMSMKVSGGRSYYYVVPLDAGEEMFLKIKCKNCNSRYAVIGSAFFCPCCGHNCAEETFSNSIGKIQAKIKSIDLIRTTLEQVNKDQAELTCRSLIETSINEMVVAFQRFCEVSFKKLAPNEALKLNAFQRLDTGEEYWKRILNEGYSDWVTAQEYNKLNELFQKRHLLSHTEGIVDQKYIEKSGDTTYQVGQRVVIKVTDVEVMLDLVNQIVTALKNKILERQQM